MNLLPWREKQRKQTVIKVIIQWTVLSIIMLMILFFFLTWQQNIEQQLYYTRQHISQLKKQLSRAKGDIQKLRQNTVKHKVYHVLKIKNIEAILNLLPFLPIQQGELQKVMFDADSLVLQGIALNQQEFADIEQYLMKAPYFKQQKLTAFNPTTKYIFFEFSLRLKGGVDE